MPKDTFYNLPAQKQQTLLEALKKEFSRASLFEASIANIVKLAGIPRGSFYQYFADKEDAYFFLLDTVAKHLKQTFASMLKAHEGDLFAALLAFYQFIIQQEENANFLRNVFLNMTHKVEKTFANVISDNDRSERRAITPLIDTEKLNISNDEELFHVMRIVSSVTFRNFVEKFARGLSCDEAINDYEQEIDLLKKGLSSRSTKR
ncbi:MAG TPA: TetR/AcrR family transcriptional regulator [Bacillota bacterium]|nr:TetR/AcrR family transcriptional regulator [Bacillota bacterium]